MITTILDMENWSGQNFLLPQGLVRMLRFLPYFYKKKFFCKTFYLLYTFILPYHTSGEVFLFLIKYPGWYVFLWKIHFFIK